MKSSYTRLVGTIRLAVLDLMPDVLSPGENNYIISRINVPQAYRGQRIGSQLLKECLADADKEGAVLSLEINPYGELTYEDLESWYLRYGFKEVEQGWYKRLPK
jgi:predicted GNAT family N-acyltransferase